MAELRRRRDEPSRADLVELRLDGVPDVDVEAALAGRRSPVIVTCRPVWEGGRFDGSEDERRRILERAMALGAEYVDVEWRAGFDSVIRARGGAGVVVSLHDFDGVPRDLAARYAAMRATGASVVKLAVTARRLADCLLLADLGYDAAGDRTVLIAMGTPGVPTRVLPSRFGSCWTYGGDAAPGQVDVGTLVDGYRVRQQSSSTAIYGLLGSPLAHSVSPAMHNAFFAAARLDAVYLPLEAESIDDFLAFACDARVALRGASITAPFKVGATAFVAEIDAVAASAGAVNTVRRDAHGWIGTNTDVPALLSTLPPALDVASSRVAVLGAGGAARAVVVALRGRGARPTVYSRRTHTDGSFDSAGTPLLSGLPPRGSWDVLVNATPVGTYPATDDTPIPLSLLNEGLVYDLVYNPPVTRLQREARGAGCAVIGGLEMLVRQAELQAEFWTGLGPPAGVMRRAAVAALGPRRSQS